MSEFDAWHALCNAALNEIGMNAVSECKGTLHPTICMLKKDSCSECDSNLQAYLQPINYCNVKPI